MKPPIPRRASTRAAVSSPEREKSPDSLPNEEVTIGPDDDDEDDRFPAGFLDFRIADYRVFLSLTL